MPKAVVIGSLFGVVILGAILFLSMGLTQYTCEVCVEFKGRAQCDPFNNRPPSLNCLRE